MSTITAPAPIETITPLDMPDVEIISAEDLLSMVEPDHDKVAHLIAEPLLWIGRTTHVPVPAYCGQWVKIKADAADTTFLSHCAGCEQAQRDRMSDRFNI